MNGGYADFDNFKTFEKYAAGRSQAIPYDKTVEVKSKKLNQALTVDGNSKWTVVKLPLGRIALRSTDGKMLSVQKTDNYNAKLVKTDKPDETETFQWMELEGGDIVLMNISSNCLLSYHGNGKAAARIKLPSANRNEDFVRFVIK